MNDEYISREAVLKAFKLTAKNRNKDYQRGLQDAIDCLVPEVIADIPSADVQPVNQWISCKDKMPEDNTIVLFVYVSENGIKSVHYGYHQTIKGLGSSWAKPSGGWQYCDDDVTYWQPLPEPPKDGDTECQ